MDTPKNSAFVFIKPHAVTEKVKALVSEQLEQAGLKITSSGSISAEEIDQGQLIDNHYYAIASKATLLTPDKLNVPPEKFQKQFGISWKDALADGKCYNAADAAKKLKLSSEELEVLWGKTKKAKKMVKFGGGFYCGEVEPGMYVFNGFFMSMRNKFVKPGVSIYYFVVEWDATKLSWEDFRGNLLGPTDPATAPPESLRGIIYKQWKDLDLAAMPDTGDNGVHASASPFEALAEQMNWLGRPIESLEFGQAMLASGIPKETIEQWSRDPQVVYGPTQIKASLFDTLEDTDADMCLALATMVNGSSGASGDSGVLSVDVILGVALGAILGFAIAKKCSV